jgi:hypothetical protein
MIAKAKNTLLSLEIGNQLRFIQPNGGFPLFVITTFLLIHQMLHFSKDYQVPLHFHVQASAEPGFKNT